jgi:hypothetical protein
MGVSQLAATTSTLLQHKMATAIFWPSIIECLEHLVLSVCRFSSHCLLTPLMKPKDRTSELTDLTELRSPMLV